MEKDSEGHGAMQYGRRRRERGGPAARRQVGCSWSHFARAVRWGGTAVLGAAVLCFLALSWHWRVVSDAALMHYVVWLQEQGWAPYRVVHDINLPGAWLADWVVMRVTSSDVGWRVYDFGLLMVALAAMVSLSSRRDWFAGIFAGGLFALLHGRDGMGQAGQRDLAMAVLFLVAAALFQEGLRRARALQTAGLGRVGLGDGELGGVGLGDGELGGVGLGGVGLLWGGMGFALGAAATIKPFGAVFFLLFLTWALVKLRKSRRVALVAGLSAGGGFALPLLGALLFLVHAHAWGSFVTMCRLDLPYHAGAARPPFLGMVRAAFHPSILKLCVLPLVIFLLRRGWRSWEARLLLVGIAFGLFCFFAQHKGYGYQRYPYLVFLLLWVGRECTAALRAESKVLRGLGVGGVLFGLCFCVPSYLRSIARAAWPEPYLEAIEQDLRLEGGSALSGRVQCVDSISGCINVLYRMRLKQTTGMIYDEFLFPSQAESPLPEAVVEARRTFLTNVTARPPQVFVVASWLFPEGPGEYRKLCEWGEFRGLLARQYGLVDERGFGRGENGPLGFRVYVRKERNSVSGTLDR